MSFRTVGPTMVAVTGLSGSGKSTALSWLIDFCDGTGVYLGDVVLEYQSRAGLPQGPEGERQARAELQLQQGAGFAVKARQEVILASLAQGRPVFVDAAFRIEEVCELSQAAGRHPFHLLAINASFETRCARLARRINRPFTPDQVRHRDHYELHKIGTGQVIERATGSVDNDATLENFHAALTSWALVAALQK